MRLLYEHRNPPRTGLKAALILAGIGIVAMQVITPTEGLWRTWGLWALASSLMLAGVALLMLPPIIHIWITQREVILHPLRLHRRIPVQHIHDLSLSDASSDGPVLTLNLRNGEQVELESWAGDVKRIAAILQSLGAMGPPDMDLDPAGQKAG